VFELHSDQQLYRPAEALDLRIRDWLKLDGRPRSDPGPPPEPIRILEPDGALTWSLESGGAILSALNAIGLFRAGDERLVHDADQIVWKKSDGREDAVALDALEMIRVDGKSLVLIDREFETRIVLPSEEAAEWMRAFLEYRLAGMSSNVPYR
jgi:hypothetical protein